MDRFESQKKRYEKVVAKGETDKRKPAPLNSSMEDAHAEIGVIQQAYDAGKTQGKDMVIYVTRHPCDYCKADIARMAEKAGLKSLKVISSPPELDGMKMPKLREPKVNFHWEPGMKKLEIKDEK